MVLTRRNVLNALGMLAGVSVVGRHAAAGSGPPIGEELAGSGELVAQAPSAAPPAAGLALVLHFRDGTSRTFSQAAAKDAGDYVGQFVHQKCFRQRQGDWTVFFRPDADGSRDEVVVELGTIRSTNPANILTPYTATITKNGATVAEVQVPYHWWWARWRWYSSPRSVVRKPADLIASKALLPHTTKYHYGWPGWGSPSYYNGLTYSYKGPMDTAGLATGMGGVGDRPEVGPVTIPQGDYIVNGTPAALSSMLAQAEASGSMPIHFRDELTGAPFDVRANPYYSTLAASGPPLIAEPPIPRDTAGSVLPTFFLMDANHTPSLCYVPYLLTDDPYYLEELQYISTFHIVITNYHTSAQQLPGLVYPGETRGFAWGVRSVAHSAYITSPTAPNWLKSQTYWKQNLADNRTYLQRFQNSPALVHKLFRMFTRSDGGQGFMNDYMAIVLAWIVRMGFTEWADGYTWFMGGVMPMVSDGSGWEKGWPTPYQYFTMTNQTASSGTAFLLVPDTSLDAITYPTWAALFQRYVADKGNTNDSSLQTFPPPWNGTSIMQVQSGPGYFLWRQGALHLAVGLGLSGASAASAWLDGQMPSVMQKSGTTSDPRWSLDSSA